MITLIIKQKAYWRFISSGDLDRVLLESVQGISAECGQLQSSCSVMQQRSELGFSRLVNITQVIILIKNSNSRRKIKIE